MEPSCSRDDANIAYALRTLCGLVTIRADPHRAPASRCFIQPNAERFQLRRTVQSWSSGARNLSNESVHDHSIADATEICLSTNRQSRPDGDSNGSAIVIARR